MFDMTRDELVEFYTAIGKLDIGHLRRLTAQLTLEPEVTTFAGSYPHKRDAYRAFLSATIHTSETKFTLASVRAAIESLTSRPKPEDDAIRQYHRDEIARLSDMLRWCRDGQRDDIMALVRAHELLLAALDDPWG